jgi:CheY-like chemotaxis protein
MTLYQKRLNELVLTQMPQADGRQIVDRLFQLGVIDNTLLKVLVIREYVEKSVRQGESKLNAMWQATEIFACTYEYVRKCVYYYKDVNLIDS